MTVGIRDALPGDVPALVALLAGLGYPDEIERVAARARAFEADPASFLLVAEEGGGAVGLASATTLPLLHEPGSWCRLSALAVAEGRRRAGVGRRLVEAVAERARAAGCRYLEVTSGERPERAPAHAFYAALGFEEVSRRFLRPL